MVMWQNTLCSRFRNSIQIAAAGLLITFGVSIKVDSKEQMKTSNVQFQSGRLQIKNKKLKVEVAITNEQHAYGLMNRSHLPENSGMLFVFSDEDYRSFWMKNTFINLSIAYIDSKFVIKEIIDMKATQSSLDNNPPSYPSTVKAKYALEVNQGWFTRNSIKIGDRIKNLKY